MTLYPSRFGYYSPETVDEAVNLLARFGEDARLVAGGQSLIPLMKLRLASPKYLIDIRKLGSMAFIRDEGKAGVRIGAFTTHHAIEQSNLLLNRYRLISEVASSIGDLQVRNMGTIGGSLAHADPAGDWGTALIATDASIVAQSRAGSHTYNVDKFFLDTFRTTLKHEEIISEVRIPFWGNNASGCYAKLKKKAGDFATVSVAVQIKFGADRTCERAGIALGAVGPTPLKATKASEYLIGKVLTESNVEEASALASKECTPSSDLRGSDEFKRAMIEAYSRRAILSTLARSDSHTTID